MRYIELFAGVGGFRYGIKRAYQASEKRTGEKGKKGIRSEANKLQDGGIERLDNSSPTILKYPFELRDRQPTCVYANEWDKYANSVYRRHYGECDSRDIREVRADEIPDHDLLTGGFPCQAFSVAGKRGGFDDTRGTLFFEIARILKAKRPRYLLLENVKGLLSHDSGKTFQTIIGVLADIGYECQWQVLNSKDFGVPQNRERVFIVGHSRNQPRPKVFPITSTNSKDIVQINQPTHSNDRIYSKNGVAPTLNTMQGGRRQPKIAVPVLTPDRENKRQNGRRFKTNGEPAFTVNTQDRHGVFDGIAIRRLTPLECERLQGFPDNWTEYGADGEKISDAQRYKQMGNAVTTNVITAIVSKMFKTLQKEQE